MKITNGKRGRYLSAIVTLFAGVAISLILFMLVRHFEQKRLEAEFRVLADERVNILVNRIADKIDVLHSIVAFYAASKSVEEDEFHEFTTPLFRQYPHILALRWVRYVPDAHRKEFEDNIGKERLADFKIKDLDKEGNLIVAPKSEEYYVIEYGEPAEKHKHLIGFNSLSDPVRAAALRKARDEGDVVLSSRVRLFDVFKMPNFSSIAFAPIYHNGMPVNTVEERRKNLAGFISIVFNVGELVEATIKDLKVINMNMYIYDMSAAPNGRLLYFHKSRTPGSPTFVFSESELNNYKGLHYHKEFDVGGRRWEFVFVANPQFLKIYQTWQAWLVLSVGLLLTILLFIYLFDILGRSAMIADMVNQRTAELNATTKQLKDSEENFRTIFESSHDAIMIASPNGKFLRANHATLEMFKCPSVEEFIAATPADVSPEYQPDGELSAVKSKKMMDMAIENGTSFFEWVHKRMDGSEFPATVLLSRFEIKGEKVLEATVRDITAQKEAEGLVKKAAKEWETTFDSMSDGVSIQNVDYEITNVNATLCKMLGKKKEEVVGKKCYEIFHGTSSPIPGCPFTKSRITNGKEHAELFEPHLKLWVSVSVSPVFDPKGKLINFVHVVRDITERKKAEEAIRESRDYLDKIINSVADPIFVKDRQHCWTMVNDAFCAFMGYKRELILGKSDYDFFPKKEADVFWEKDELVFRTSQENINEEKFTDAKGMTHTIMTKKTLYVDVKGERLIVGVIRDITDIKRLENIKDEFVSTVSHELRTPLSITKEGISLVLDGIPGKINAKQSEVLSVAKNNIDRLSRIINDLLDISKIKAGRMIVKKETVSLVALIKQVATFFEPKIKGMGLKLELDLPAEDIKIYADGDRIIQVITNLVGNAIKFTSKGAIKISAQEKDREVECAVSDTGIGIAKEDLSKLFGKFQQISRVPGPGDKGTGLGLSIAKGIVELHSGKIWAESEPGKGTSVIFTLPKYTSEDILKERLGDKIREASRIGTKISLIGLSLSELNKLKRELSDDKVHSILNDIEAIVKNKMRTTGDVAFKGTNEIFVVCPECDKDGTLIINERLERAINEYLRKEGLVDKVKIQFGYSIYPEEKL